MVWAAIIAPAAALAVAVMLVLPWVSMLRRVVRVEVDTGQTFEGVLWSRVGRVVRLKMVTVYTVDGGGAEAAGDYTIPYGRVVSIVKKP